MPDLMAAMLEQKIGHPKAGANTAWVPSPTAATLHATHYHQASIRRRGAKAKLKSRAPARNCPTSSPCLSPSGRTGRRRTSRSETRQQCPGHPRLCRALGGPGRRLLQGARHQRCRPDGRPRHAAHLGAAHGQLAAPQGHRIGSPGGRDDEANGRRSSITQNEGDAALHPHGVGTFEGSIAFRAALDLVLKGREQPNGYTEPVLHRRRHRTEGEGCLKNERSPATPGRAFSLPADGAA
jgi:malate synthase